MTALPVRLACELEACPEEQRWLIEEVWAERGVGVLGGSPKLGKSWAALDAALSVAAGVPFLRRFAVRRPGPVLLFAAEDALHVVRERLEAIARTAGVRLEQLPIHVITAPRVRLDVERDRVSLRETIQELRPRLLVLDPFIRLHAIDENVAGDVAPLLAYLRQLEREFTVAVLLVHHARKGGATRPGQALRGSSELHAWGDSNLYLQRRGEVSWLTVEHRAAPSPAPMAVAISERAGGVSMTLVAPPAPGEAGRAPPPRRRVLDALTAQARTVRDLRERSRMRTSTLCDVLAELVAEGLAEQADGGYRRSDLEGSVSACSLGTGGNGNGKRDDMPGETEVGSAGEHPAEG